MDRNLIDYLPQMIQTIREFKAIAEAEQPEVAELWNALDDVLADQFILDATENGVSRWENVLSIVPQATKTIDQRKLTILAKINSQTPYTLANLKHQLETVCGPEGYTATLSNETYTLTVRVALTNKSIFSDVEELLNRVVPANILIDVSLKYNTHQDLSKFTHAQLSAYTHVQLREEVL